MLSLIRTGLLLLLTAPTLLIAGQQEPLEPLSFLQLQHRMTTAPRPVLITLNTSWCTYCRLQEAQFRKNDSLCQLVRNNFYWVALNAESRQDIVFNNEVYSYDAASGTHCLATALAGTDAQPSYPTLILLNEHYEVQYRQAGFVPAKHCLTVLKYFKQ